MMKKISLNGTWTCRHAGGYRGGSSNWPAPQTWMPSYDITIPGTVQEAMEHLTGDVHIGHNVLNARWIEEETWLLTCRFTLSDDDLADGTRVRLVMSGVLLYANLHINHKPVGEHHNFFTPIRIDVTDHLVAGENRLDIILESGLLSNAFKPAGDAHGLPRERAMRRSYCRSPQSAFEWDWSPRLLNVGICGDVYLELAPIFVNEASVFHDLNEDYSEATIRIRQFLSVPTGRKVQVKAAFLETNDCAEVVETVQGESFIPLNLTVKNPKLWYPKNHGDPYRYTLRITVVDASTGETICVTDRRIGLRHVEIDQSLLPDGGRLFRLMINGRQFFAKGANMVPADILFSRCSRDVYEVLIDRALEANFNALRVWGGGLYESDDFFELCDERGIIVWQDFIGACASYPAQDRDFVMNYRDEIAYNLRRMSPYASAVIYCGNNEIDHDMAVDFLLHTYSCAALYYSMVPKIMHDEGDNHYYQPSSPYSPDGSIPNSDKVGDQHPWKIGFANRDYYQYREMDCRFPNEGGILGPTSLPNMMAALGEGQDFMYSFDFKLHDNSIADNEVFAPERLFEEKLGKKIAMGDLSIADYVYYGGFFQGEGLTEYILNFRRRMSTTTDAAIFWMYADCWPATRSWTIVDYLRNRTPSFYPVKRAFAPVVVDIVEAKTGGFDIYGINEYLSDQCLTLKYAAVSPTAKGSEVFWNTIPVRLPANASTILTHIDVTSGTIPCAQLEDAGGNVISRRRFVNKPYHELGLLKPDIRVTVDGNFATYYSETLALGVCLDLDGDDGELSDNYFDLFPGVPYTVKLGKQSGEIKYHLLQFFV